MKKNLVGFTWSSLKRYDKRVCWISLCIIVLDVAIPYTEIFLPKLAAELLLEQTDTWLIARNFIEFALLIAVLRFLYNYFLSQRTWRLSYVCQGTSHDLLAKNLECRYEYSQDAATQARYGRLRQMVDAPNTNCYVRLLYAFSSVMSGVLGLTAYTIIFVRFNAWLILLLTASSLIHFFVARKAALYEHSIKDKVAAVDKKLHYLSRVTADPSSGKDIRLYHAAPWLIKWFRKQDGLHGKYDKEVESSRFWGQFICSTIGLLRDGVTYGWLIWMVLHGTLRLDDFVLALGIVRGFSSFLLQVLNGLISIQSAALHIDDIVQFYEGGSTEAPEEPVPPSSLELPIDIEFRDLSYSYPNGKTIFDRISLKIKPGEKIALVGFNGAGKTTLMDLLCGLRRPTGGQILLNGYDTCQFSPEDLLSLFGPVFQKNFILPASLAVNIAPDSPEDEEGVRRCLDRAGLGADLRAKGRSIEAPVTRVAYEDGIEFSGGQKQKLYLARMLYKNSPIVILDEPTSALDPIAEAQVYEQYADLIEGRTAIFISHRLASTRFCDRILFLKDGVVIEDGTHDVLMEKQGAYYELFQVQSRYYTD